MNGMETKLEKNGKELHFEWWKIEKLRIYKWGNYQKFAMEVNHASVPLSSQPELSPWCPPAVATRATFQVEEDESMMRERKTVSL